MLVENQLENLKTFDSNHFTGKSHFEENGTQNYLVFQPINRYFKVIANTKYILSWKSKRLSDDTIKPPATSDNSLSPLIDYLDKKVRLKFNGGCSKQQNKPIHTHSTIVNIYNVYELGASGFSIDDSTLRNSLFGVVKLNKNADIDRYRYSGYGIGFDRKESFSFPGGGFGQNIIIFGVDMSSSVHVDNKKKDILIIGKGPTQGLGEHSLTAEKMYSINFTMTRKKFSLSLHYNGVNNYWFLNGTEIIKLKVKGYEIVATPLCLGNISKDWTVDNMTRTGFNGYVYDFRVDYDAIAVNDILDIHKYLMKKNNMIKKCLGLFKKCFLQD